MKTIRAEYFAETGDEKTAGTIILRTDTVVSAYSLPRYSKRTLVMTEQGHKFCLKGKPEDFLPSEEEALLAETAN
tara:strand:- start:1267 stop:1491 length:225 start_codon:yes stop_codon:yes gene_type:complete